MDYEQEHIDKHMTENQWKDFEYFVDCGQHPNDDDIPSTIEIQSDRVAPSKVGNSTNCL